MKSHTGHLHNQIRSDQRSRPLGSASPRAPPQPARKQIVLEHVDLVLQEELLLLQLLDVRQRPSEHLGLVLELHAAVLQVGPDALVGVGGVGPAAVRPVAQARDGVAQRLELGVQVRAVPLLDRVVGRFASVTGGHVLVVGVI